MEDLNAASEQDYIDFYKTYYVPNNAVLVIAGDVKAADMRKLVEKYFAAIPRGKDIVRPTAEEPQLKGRGTRRGA
jgi:zinc protease